MAICRHVKLLDCSGERVVLYSDHAWAAARIVHTLCLDHSLTTVYRAELWICDWIRVGGT